MEVIECNHMCRILTCVRHQTHLWYEVSVIFAVIVCLFLFTEGSWIIFIFNKFSKESYTKRITSRVLYKYMCKFVCLALLYIVKLTIHHNFPSVIFFYLENRLIPQTVLASNDTINVSLYNIDNTSTTKNLSCSFPVPFTLMVHPKEILDRPVLELYCVQKMGRCIFLCKKLFFIIFILCESS